MYGPVSTPHGGLATLKNFRRCRMKMNVSTPHGGLATYRTQKSVRNISLVSTPHGGLATSMKELQAKIEC